MNNESGFWFESLVVAVVLTSLISMIFLFEGCSRYEVDKDLVIDCQDCKIKYLQGHSKDQVIVKGL